MNTIRTATTITTLGLVAMMMAGCASGASTASVPDGGTDTAPSVTEVRFGYFANVTHAPALVVPLASPRTLLSVATALTSALCVSSSPSVIIYHLCTIYLGSGGKTHSR